MISERSATQRPLAVKRKAWMVVYARQSAPTVTLRELYWSEESASERAAALLPHCAEVFIGLMAEVRADA